MTAPIQVSGEITVRFDDPALRHIYKIGWWRRRWWFLTLLVDALLHGELQIEWFRKREPSHTIELKR